MSKIIYDINLVRSFRKDLRDPILSPNVMNAIQMIHTCVQTGTDLQGWKKVDWRNGNGGSGAGGRGQGGHQTSGNGGHRGGFFHNKNGGHSGGQGSRRYGNGSVSGGSGSGSNNTASVGTNTSSTNNTDAAINTSAQHVDTGSTHNLENHTLPTTANKYVSRFKKNSDKVDDTILNTIILGKLNKFSVANYDEIKEFITHIIDNGQTELIKCFMKLVFQKAASEETFCPLYAKLISELSSSYPQLLTEMTNLYTHYIKIFEEMSDVSAENYTEFLEMNVEKKYRRGYSQFIAELIKHNVIDTIFFMKTIDTIIKQTESSIYSASSNKIVEEYADCLMKIMKAISNNTGHDNEQINIIKSDIKDTLSDKIKPLTIKCSDFVGLSNKARFTFLDIYESVQKL